jgi:peptidoglycan-associated lipoprotein
MRIFRVLLIAVLVLGLAACSCRTRKVGPGGENIGMAGEEGVLKDVNFAFDSYKIDGKAKDVLNANAEWLKANAGSKVQIEGHCDERGTNEYNMALGNNRARAAFDYLRTLGVEVSRMSTVSYGEELPLDPRHNEEAWAKNRRAHSKLQ